MQKLLRQETKESRDRMLLHTSCNLVARINPNYSSIGRYEIKLVKLGFRLFLLVMTLKSCQHFAKNKAFVNEFEMRPRGFFPAIFLLFTSIDVNDLD